MTRISDLGGIVGFGRVPHDPDEPTFHAPWEGRVCALYLSKPAGVSPWSIDHGRHVLERLEPRVYLRSYYERWLAGAIKQLEEHGFLAPGEVTARAAEMTEAPVRVGAPEAAVDAAVAVQRQRHSYEREAEGLPAAFEVGARVRTVGGDPSGHTRLPRYARGKVGEVVMRHGVHVFPDANAAGLGESPTHLYAVRFAAEALWGDEAEPETCMTLDLWHPHLEAA